MKIVDLFIQSIRKKACYNPDVQVAPACILWPDYDRQWEPVIARLQSEMPELCILGEYAPAKRTGPAIWLRCAIAGKSKHVEIPQGRVPIIYLPGFTRQDLRAIEQCPPPLVPLAELQYRGVIWSQINNKDWTILAFLSSEQEGLQLDVTKGSHCKSAMQRSLYRLLDEEIDVLRDKRLDKDYFNTLLTDGDPVRELLQWLDKGETFKSGRDENTWCAFVEICKSQFAFNPDDDGPIKGAANLAKHRGSWLSVWERYCESAERYPNIPILICKAEAPLADLFADAKTHGGWPQWNDRQERSLREDLIRTKDEVAHKARNSIKKLEEKHCERRSLVWAELGEAPLANALEHLLQLAKYSEQSMAAGTIADLSASYRSWGWQADEAALKALACVNKDEDLEAVKAAIHAVYMPWLEDSAQYLQKQVETHGYPGGIANNLMKIERKPGLCYFFIDGLRLDIAKRLIKCLQAFDFSVSEKPTWVAIPSVTATGKPAITPVHHLITGQDVNADFEPCVKASGQSLKGGYQLKKLLKENDWQIIDRQSNGDPNGSAWCEVGDIDSEGHKHGWRLAKYLDALVEDISDRIRQLFAAGWKTIHIVTDHGWLLLPGGMPQTKLPRALSENTWGRCAAIKPEAISNERHFPWSWNPNVHFALPAGVSCYKAHCEYTHGGISLQECMTLELIVTLGATTDGIPVTITDVTWKGLRCKVTVEGDPTGLSLDLRTHPGNAKTSIATVIKTFNTEGTSSVVVEDETLEGDPAYIAVIDHQNRLIAQKETQIGER